MALIENLEHDNWRSFLNSCFSQAVELLATDRFRWAGSSIDDLKSWLAAGGVGRVKQHLNKQMELRRFPLERKVAINDELISLARKHRQKLLALMTDDVIAFDKSEVLSSLSLTEREFEQSLQLILAGGNPFEDWMRVHDRSDDEIAAVYQVVDRWLTGDS
ncbi:MAG: hypothetical protein AAF716_20700 [Cyanobacteria bacterium P01_D01_bin.1]